MIRLRPPFASRRGGFTLIEILIALAVVAVVSVTIVSAVSGMLANSLQLSDMSQCDLLVRALADDVRARGLPEKREGSFDSHPEFRWTISERAPRDPMIENLGMKEYEFVVTSPEGRKGRLVSLMESPGSPEPIR